MRSIDSSGNEEHRRRRWGLEPSTVFSGPALGGEGFKKSLHLSGQGGCRI